MKHSPNGTNRLVILRIVTIYAFFSGLWIYLSDNVVGFLIRDPATIVRISVFKGILFIILTSYLLYQRIARYIRESKQAEQALRESEERYRQLVEYSPDAILVHDGSEYTFANDAALRLFGADTPEQLLGKPVMDLVHPDSREMVKGRIRQLLEMRTATPLRELQMIRLDGTVIDAETVGSPITYQGNPVVQVVVRDITARKRIEDSLRNSEEKFRLFFEHAPAAVAMFDRNMRYILYSRRWLTSYGLGEQDLTGRSHYDVFPEIPERWKAVHSRCLAGAIEKCEEDPFRRLDGKTDWVRWEVRPWCESSGVIGGIIMFTEVITEHKRMEEELRESEKRLNKAQEIAHLGSWELDVVTNILTWSDEVYRIFGLQPQEFGATYEAFLEAVHPDDRPAVDAAYSGSLRERRDTYEIEHRVVRRSTEEIRYVHEKCEHMRDDTGRIIRSIGMVHDITERKVVEEAQKESDRRYRSLFENMLDGFAFCKMLFDDQGRPDDFVYLDVNNAFSRLTGLDNVVGKKVTEVIPGVKESYPELFEIYGRVALAGRPETFEIDFKPLGIWLFVAVYSIQREYFVAVFENITERKRAEEAQKKANEELELRVAERTEELEESRLELEKQNEKLRETYHELEAETAERIRAMGELREKDQMLIQQSRQAAMGEMLGNIAHQWRQPLNVLGLKVQEIGLSYELGGFSKELLDDNIAKAMEILQHMSQTIDDFRDFTAPDKGRSLFRVDQVVAKTVSLIEESFREREVVVDVSTSGEPMITGYPNEYAQVLLNILMNAKDAFQERGTTDARVTVRSWEEDGRAVITITDNAGGIKEEIIDKIFDAYYTTKELGKGTGVGLFMSKTIIEKNMGGRLTVRNVEDGAEFRIEV